MRGSSGGSGSPSQALTPSSDSTAWGEGEGVRTGWPRQHSRRSTLNGSDPGVMTQLCKDVCVCDDSMFVQHRHLGLQSEEATQLHNVALPSVAKATSNKTFSEPVSSSGK